MRKLIYIMLIVLFSAQLQAVEFSGVFWNKKNCKEFTADCLPRYGSEIKLYSIDEPPVNGSSRLRVDGEKYDVLIYLARKSGQHDYYMFQVELLDKAGKTISVCSRYEGIKTFEDVPVGACAGVLVGTDLIVGFSTMLPEAQ